VEEEEENVAPAPAAVAPVRTLTDLLKEILSGERPARDPAPARDASMRSQQAHDGGKSCRQEVRDRAAIGDSAAVFMHAKGSSSYVRAQQLMKKKRAPSFQKSPPKKTKIEPASPLTCSTASSSSWY